jgi:hypothetical protein
MLGGRMTNPRVGFDPVAIVIDWLDACKDGRLQDLLALYDDNATIECACVEGIFHGRAGVEQYWRDRLENDLPEAFLIDDVMPDGEGVVLDFHNHDGQPIRIRFVFDPAGNIVHTACRFNGANCSLH